MSERNIKKKNGSEEKSGRCRYSQSIMAESQSTLSRIKRAADEQPLTFHKNHKEREDRSIFFHLNI